MERKRSENGAEMEQKWSQGREIAPVGARARILSQKRSKKFRVANILGVHFGTRFWSFFSFLVSGRVSAFSRESPPRPEFPESAPERFWGVPAASSGDFGSENGSILGTKMRLFGSKKKA